ncbi:MAG TPA: FAD/NAD(P)-binding protein [Candidatus Dormibacteraeota bacterium]
MQQIEVDYLVVGAGASGLAFTDTLIASQDVDVLIVDRQHAPGGHWLSAYPFVRLHQPSAVYGAPSRKLGEDRIDTNGPNAGFYERATADGIRDYFEQLLNQDLVPSGKVRFWDGHDYRGETPDGHVVTSLTTGVPVAVKVRKRLVDASYLGSDVPSRRRPTYSIDDGARVIPPNQLVELADAPSGFNVYGAGKTAMDTCVWLLEAGVDPDRIRWVRGRDPWVFDRAAIQPLDLVATYLNMQARWVEACAQAEDGHDFARRLESHGVVMRIDPSVEPDVWRGATVSRHELGLLRSIERVERGRVTAVGTRQIALEDRALPTSPDEVHVDCTAPGLRVGEPRPVFEPGRITMQHVVIGSACWSAAVIGALEGMLAGDDDERNRLSPTIDYEGSVSSLLKNAYYGLTGSLARTAVSELNAWDRACRLNPLSAARQHRQDSGVVESYQLLVANLGPALENLERRTRPEEAVAAS